ncbi:S8 family serine peptidase [Steroidobacter agaridevorans]|uniref:S8 family serine peptidase n=1 Tax=Steroidobacter agaridevorans TaxID=2695856 RepID=UPI00137AF65A|nr:S8 family serine peptidase [Steroidobacter agaridevorans]
MPWLRFAQPLCALAVVGMMAGCSPGGSESSSGAGAQATSSDARGQVPVLNAAAADNPFVVRGQDGNLTLEVDAPSAQAHEPAVAAGELLVKFKSSAAYSSARAKFGAAVQSQRSFKSLPGLQRVKVAPGVSTAATIAALREDPDVEFVEPNYIVRAQRSPNDPSFTAQWPLHNIGQSGGVADADIDATEAWDITTSDSSVVIAVLDSGVDYTHQDLAANIFSNTADCNTNGIDDDANGYVDDCHGIDTVNGDSNPMDDNGHGTHVAGLIAAVGDNNIGVTGVAWHARVLPCKFLDANGSGSVGDAIACLDYIASFHDRGVNIVATNNSWGEGIYSRALYDAIARQQQRGILFVAAAGNSTSTAPQSIDDSHLFEAGSMFPCAYPLPNVICVGASDDRDIMARVSYVGDHTIHIVAPGEDVLSTLPGNLYGVQTGTSMATPHVSGVIALVKSAMPALDWRGVKNRVLAGGDYSDHQAGWADFGWPVASRRRVNAYGALTCNSSVATRRLLPRAPVIIDRYWLGVPLTLAVLNIDCENPRGAVSVTVNPGNVSIALADDGVGADLAAGDGIYSSVWTPTAAGDYTLSFPGQIFRQGTIVADTLAVTVDAHLKPGFPVKTLHQAGTYNANLTTLVANLDASPDLEIVTTSVAHGPTYAWKATGEPLSGWPLARAGRPFVMSTLSAGNLAAGADQFEVAGGFTDDGTSSVYDPILPHLVEAYFGSGQLIPGWPRMSGNFMTSAPTLVDVDGDGLDELFHGEQDYELSAYRSDGSLVPGFPLRPDPVGEIGPQGVMSPLAADLDFDGRPELVLMRSSSTWHALIALRSDGSIAPGFPVSTPQPCQPIGLGDVDADGVIELACATGDVTSSGGARSVIQIYSPRGELERTIEVAQGAYGLRGGALADLTQDGIPEIVLSYSYFDSYWGRSYYYVGAYAGDGATLPGWPVELTGASGNSTAISAPVVGDVDGDGLPEIVATAKGTLHVLNHGGTPAAGTPKTLPQGFVYYNQQTITPAIADLDADGRNDIVVTANLWDGRNGYLPKVAAYDLGGAASSGPVEWSQELEGPQHRGYYQSGKNLPGHSFVAVAIDGEGRVSSDSSGIDCGDDCLGLFANGSNVQLSATPSGDAGFQGWIGACEGQGNPCTLTVAGYTATRAVFGGYGLALSVTGPGSVTSNVAGISCPADCSEAFDENDVVTLTAQPGPNAVFSGWSGACSGAALVCSVTMSSARSVSALFVLKPLLQIQIPGGGGTVSSTPAGIDCGATCSQYFEPNAVVQLQATPDGDRTVSWSGACSGTATTCTVIMSEARNVAVTFPTQPPVTLTITKAGAGQGTVSSSPAGISCGPTCSASFDPGSLVTLSAAADAQSVFEGWSGACTGLGNSCSVTMDRAQSVTAAFRLATPSGGDSGGAGGGTQGGGKSGGGGSVDWILLVLLAGLLGCRRAPTGRPAHLPLPRRRRLN